MASMPTCEYCGCKVEIGDLLWHESSHDQVRLLFEAMEQQLRLQDEAINLLHELINNMEARVDELALG